ncbi:MAG: cell division protein FtsL [Legionellaceae bacterium]|nr:cell division protein FtsL [Legionellaceae bacterium]
MNAAARDINQSNFFHGQIANIRLSFSSALQIGLLFAVLVSALAVVYVTNLQRVTLSQVEFEEQQTHQLQLQWGQLLLEQASLATPSRVERLAAGKLNMTLPIDKKMMVLRSQ